MKPLILASQSPRRKYLLKQIGMKFRVIPSRAAEVFSSHQSPGENA
ncbi:MAG: Maf family protein, partial [Bacteroidota bacterium]